MVGIRTGPGPGLCEMLLVLGILGMPLALLGLPLLLLRKSRRFGAVLTMFLAGLSGGSFGIFRLGQELRMHAFDALGERSRPLVEALISYQRDHGMAAPELAALVPDYLQSIPGTGMSGYPGYDYAVFGGDTVEEIVWYDLGSRHGEDTAGLWLYSAGDPDHAILAIEVTRGGEVHGAWLDRMPEKAEPVAFDPERWAAGDGRMGMTEDLAERYGPFGGRPLDWVVQLLGDPDGALPHRTGSWELSVRCSQGLVSFDTFFYWPGGNYPDSIYGGSVERLGDWAYVHE